MDEQLVIDCNIEKCSPDKLITFLNDTQDPDGHVMFISGNPMWYFYLPVQTQYAEKFKELGLDAEYGDNVVART